VLLSDQGLNPLGLRGVLPETSPGGIPGLRYVPPGFAGDSNSSTVLFTSQRFVEGGYNVREAFFEFGIPLLENGKLNLNEAFRWADYSGSGNTNAWKTGISYQATPRFRIRATRSQDVRAPTLQERFEQQRGGVNVRDPLRGNALISTASFTGGNPNVDLETAQTSVLGFVYEPTDKFSMTIDRYDVDLDGAIGQLQAQTIVNTCAASGGASSLCQFVVRDSTGQINRVEALFINLSNMRITGADLELNYSGIEVGDGTLSWRFLGSRLDENSILTPGSPRIDRAGDVGVEGLPKTKVTTSLRYVRGPISLFLQERYIGGGLTDRDLVESNTRIPGAVTIDDNTVDSVLYTDLTFNYRGGENGETPWEAFFTVNNLLDEAPPDMYSVVGRAGVGGPNTLLYDTIGRRFTAGVRVNF
jgi:outer membrane receptor protein involved in Fe transport